MGKIYEVITDTVESQQVQYVEGISVSSVVEHFNRYISEVGTEENPMELLAVRYVLTVSEKIPE